MNLVLAQMDPPAPPIVTLDTPAMTNSGWQCFDFAGTLLAEVCAVTHAPEGESTRYAPGAALPNAFPPHTFVNVVTMGDPSALNHGFDILVVGPATFLIQAFLGDSVRLVQRFPNETFITNWHAMSDPTNAAWADAYAALFGIAPSAVVQNPPAATWLQEQIVTY